MRVTRWLQSKDRGFLIRCSYLEIYNETIRDLLAQDTPERQIREDKKRVRVSFPTAPAAVLHR
ncbi:hypothetical protein EON66_09455 [archaeon]|nr:MAG: hypothetical protein EON66_09455 [archaeon]